MNLRNISKIFSATILGLLLLFVGCSSNDELNLDSTEALTSDEVANIVEADDVSAEIEEVLEDDAIDYGLTAKGTRASSSSVADCVIRTVVTTSSSISVTLDFGEGCETRRGKFVAGILTIDYVQTSTGFSKTVNFQDFFVNGHQIIGSMSAERVKENANGNPQSTIMVDLKVVFESGVEISRKGERVREKIEGADTLERGDDVFSISGNWESVNRNGVVRKAVITTNLIRKFACKFIVSGVVEITKNDKVYTLDFGDGTCDNIAMLSDEEGNTNEISLRR